MEKTITIEIAKLKNKEQKKLFEWTKTFEIDYEVSNNTKTSKEEKEIIQKEIELINELNEKKSLNNSPLINTTIFEMGENPFYQPSMNTFEFKVNNDEILVSVSKNSDQPLSDEEKIKALEKLLDEKVIDQHEFNEQKKQIISFQKHK